MVSSTSKNASTHFVVDELVNWDEVGKSYAIEKDFQREHSALMDCKGPYIQELVRVDNGNKYLFCTYYRNAIPLNKFGIEQVSQFLDVLPAIIRAIDHCHRSGWVHGDIKPSNILFIPETGSIRLIDFGASFPLGTNRQGLDCWQVSKGYSPENKLKGLGEVTVSDDWYALSKMIDQTISFISDKKIRSRAISIKCSLTHWFNTTLIQ